MVTTFTCASCSASHVGNPARCYAANPLTADERTELINRPFFITRMDASYPWSGTIVTNQFRRSVEDLLEEAEERELRREMRLALLQTDDARFLALAEDEHEDRATETADYRANTAPDQDFYALLRPQILNLAANHLTDDQIATTLGIRTRLVRSIRANLGV